MVAGPGAGKTRVLTHAIAHRIGAGLPPERCLAVTFTRRARDELRDRLAALLGDQAAGQVTVATFHGLGLLILREQCKLLGLPADLAVADEKTRLEVLRSLSGGDSPAALGARIAESKRRRVAAACTDFDPADDPADDRFPEDGGRFGDPVLDGQAARYDAALRERGLVDVDELVTRPVELLSSDPALAAGYRERWTDVFVDEYQDVDEQQYLMLRQLAAPGAGICAIGDPDQAIYGFRGGDVGYFLRFAEDFGGAATVRLSRSYRSAPTIVRAAMQLIRPGTLVPGRELVPARTDIPDGPVTVHAVADEREEAEVIAAEVEQLLGGASFHALDSRAVDGRERAAHQLSFADFAVLYRTSAQAAALGEALARRGFPFQRRAHTRLTELPGVTEILAALPAADQGALDGVQPGSTAVTGLLDAALGRALESLAGPPATDRANRAAAIAAVRQAADVLAPLATRCGTNLDQFLDELALGAEVDTWDPRADRISLLTLHAAKGLEFPVVFIAGLR